MSEQIVAVITASDVEAVARRVRAGSVYGEYTFQQLRRAITRAAEDVVFDLLDGTWSDAIAKALARTARMGVGPGEDAK